MPLSKTGKKGKEQKEKLVEQVRACSQEYPHAYLIRLHNSRSAALQRLRARLAQEDGTRLFIGKNRVMSLALGKDAASAQVSGAHQLAARLSGDVGLMFSRMSPVDLQAHLRDLSGTEWARTGNIAPRTIEIERIGEFEPLRRDDDMEPIPATAEPQLRQAGLPCQLRGGHIILTQPSYVVCQEGDTLTADQCRLLKLLGFPLVEFSVDLVAHLHQGNLVDLTQ